MKTGEQDDMDTYRSENTISLWDDNSKQSITLKNLQTGKRYSFVLKRSFVVGRKKESCDLQITTEDRYMSGKHLRFINDGASVYVEDLNTKNGTRLNGRPISSKAKIRRGDILKMGRSEFEVIL